MQKPYEEAKRELDIAIRFVSGDKDFLGIAEFIELHRNIYYVQPKENLTNFMNVKYIDLDDL
jgi:hypothetical protein